MNDSSFGQDFGSALSSESIGGYAVVNPYIPLATANLSNPEILGTVSNNRRTDNDEKYGFLAIKAMITSALIWVTIASWIDIIQEYMLIKEPVSLENELPTHEIEQRQCFQDRLQLRLRRRILFAIMATILTVIVAWWFHWYMARV